MELNCYVPISEKIFYKITLTVDDIYRMYVNETDNTDENYTILLNG